jgi:hypothetical protein
MTSKDDKAIEETEVGGPSQPSHRETSPVTDPTPAKVPSSRSTGLRGRKLVFPSPIAADKVKVRRPLTRAAAKQEIPVKDDGVGVSAHRKGKYIVVEKSVEIVDITTPQEDSNTTFKRLRRQLKEAIDEIDSLKKEDSNSRREIKEMLDMHHENIDKANFLSKRFLPLHGQLRNLYRKNRAHQAQIKNLKT